MQVHIRGHETSVLASWRGHIGDRLAKLDRFEDRIIRLEYVLTTSRHHLKGNELCHIIAKVPRKTIDIKKTGETMSEAIDAASKILEQKIHTLYKATKTKNRNSRDIRRVKRGVV